VQTSSNIAKVCIQNVLHVLEYKLEDVDTTAWSMNTWRKCSHFPLFDQLWFQLYRHHKSGCGHTLLQLPTNLVV